MIHHIITHSGPFHADDVFAVAVLRRLAPDAAITRTRDPTVLAAAIESDDAAPHLVDHLAIVRRHQDGRSKQIDAVEELHYPDRGIGVKVACRLVADE